MVMYSNIDMNSDVKGISFPTGNATTAAMQIVNKDGSHIDHVVALQGSLDDVNFVDLGRIGGDRSGSKIFLINVGAIQYLRYSIEILEGKDSISDIIIVTKR